MLVDSVTIDADYARSRIHAHAARRHQIAAMPAVQASGLGTSVRIWLQQSYLRVTRRPTQPSLPSSVRPEPRVSRVG